jgi:hypothetical protein
VSETSTIVYLMDPALDEIRFGSELTEGMWVLEENDALRPRRFSTEEYKIRAQRFRRVTRLTREPSTQYEGGIKVQFIGEWVDGYQEVCACRQGSAWLVRKEITEPESIDLS